MAKKTVPPKQVTKKHVAKQEKEARQMRLILTGAIVVAVIVVVLLGYVLIDRFVVAPNKVIASVGEQTIRVREFEPMVKYTRLNMINLANNYYYYYQMFGSYGESFLMSAQDLVISLNDPISIGEQVLNTMIEDILIEEEAAKRGITITDEELAQAMQEAFNFYPLGTPTPTVTPTPVNTPTMSLTEFALIQPTDTPTPLPTATSTPEGWEPTNTVTPTVEVTPTSAPETLDATPTEEPTVTSVPTITPTPTTYTTQIYGTNLKDYYNNLKSYGIPTDVVEKSTRASLLREKVMEAITADLEPKQLQVHARHILVATESEANTVLELLNNGEDWNNLAANYSTDTATKDNGGDLGWFGKGQMVAEFEEAAFALEPGQVSDPVKTEYGYHIIQCLAKGENYLNATDFENYKTTTFNNWLQDLRDSRTDIIIEPDWSEYVPTTPAVPSSLQNAVFNPTPQ
jgi:parvulin-like peptidyl-prolyl isomerase